MSKRNQVIAEARSWLGCPYHHHACVKGAGVDCAMLLVGVFHACGLIPAIDPRPYSEQWMMHRDRELFLEWLEQYGTEVDLPAPGDVVVWRFGKTFSHGGIVLDTNGTVVHAYRPAGEVVLGNLADSELVRRKTKYFTVRGIE